MAAPPIAFIAFVGITLSTSLVLLLRSWPMTIPVLLVHYGCTALFLSQQEMAQVLLPIGGWDINVLVALKVVTGLAVTAMLTVTGVTFSQEYGLENLDEFGLAELRRAARAAQRQQASQTFRIGDYVVPLMTVLLTLFVSLTIPMIYPVSPHYEIDVAWYWIGLTGVFTLATAQDTLKIGMGLLLCVGSIDLLTSLVTSDPGAGGLGLAVLLLLSVVTIVLGLMISYISGLMYGRLKTLEIAALDRQHPS